ncbi:MAG: lipoprotein [Gammaproteobacteria bacterium]|nr:lipoprotein [Gammaproteobacteria bacterium]
MKQKVAQLLLVFAISSLVMVVSGCGSKGDLFHPEESQSTTK